MHGTTNPSRNSVKTVASIATILLASAGALKAAVSDREIWISPLGRLDITNTSATPDAPWRCPYPTNLATALASLPNHVTIHLMPGTFLVTNSLQIRPGWKIRGAGIDNTIVRLAATNHWGRGAMFVMWSGGPNGSYGAEISDLTVDCNLQNQSAPYAAGAVSLRGNHVRISRVKAINWGVTSGGRQAVLSLSAFNLGAGYPLMTNGIIEGCVVSSPAAVAQSGTVAAIDIPPGSLCAESLIQNNLASDIATYAHFGFCAFSVSGTNLVMRNNRAINLSGPGAVGLYTDSSLADAVIQGNVFQNVTRCILFNDISSQAEGIVMLNNICRPCSNGAGISFSESSSAIGTNVIAAGNIVFPMLGATNVYGAYIASSSGTDLCLQFLNNILQGALPEPDVYPDGAYRLKLFTNNFNLNGDQLSPP